MTPFWVTASVFPSIVKGVLEMPFALLPFWLFPLFFAYKFVHLGLLGMWGRGIPVTSSHRRWSNWSGKLASVVLIGIGGFVWGTFATWLFVSFTE